MDDSHGEPQPIDRDTEPDRWWESAYSNTTIVTQFDDGTTAWPAIGIHRTSSASEPAMVATMLDCLDVQPGQRGPGDWNRHRVQRGTAGAPARRIPGDHRGDRPADRCSDQQSATLV
ncbi:MAG TPA: hypothetical protein VGL88_11545 [Pseudonocardiaceae bacterium]